jgi:tetratricopeptide (TPR) repeat protein
MRANSFLLKTAFAALIAVPGLAAAQQLELPRPSPLAKVSQVVGLTEVAVEYSSPAVKGRKVWGDLVPYDKLWRTGANIATKITFSKDVLVADKPVPAGSYAIFTIPGKTSWTIALNKNFNQGGTDQYEQSLDVLRFQAKPQALPTSRERLTFIFSGTTESVTSLDLEWEKLRVSLPIKAKTDEQVATAINNMVNNAWRPYMNAARYLLEAKKDLDQALKLVDQSLSIKEDWLNVWTKASILAAKGQYRDAYGLAEKAKQLGDKSPQNFFFKEDVEKALAEWKNKR